MVETLDNIRRLIDRLVLRERAFLLAEVLGRAALVVGAAALMAIIAVAIDGDRGVAGALLGLGLGIGAWAAVAPPLLLRWGKAGDRLRQARLVERLDPNFRGRLVTAVEHLDGARPGESEMLVKRTADKALATASTVPWSGVHRPWRSLVLLAGAGFLALFPLPVSFLAGGPSHVASWWLRGFDTKSVLAPLDLGPATDHAKVGDLVLVYTYPAYTGLDPRTVENSTGDASGPPGTVVQVTARSAEALETGGLVAYGQRYEAVLLDERTVRGDFTIESGEGEYQVVTYRGGEAKESRPFKVVGEEDLAPEVMVEGADRLELAEDEMFELGWRARDDFGVAVVHLRVDGKNQSRPLMRAERRVAEADGRVVRTPSELGLSAGARVRLEIAATDNDTVGGAKVGVSRSIELVVLGAKGLEERSEVALNKYVDAMLLVLAEHLEEAYPVGPASGDLAGWAEVVSLRYRPLQEMADEDWSRLREGGIERQVLTEALEGGSAIVRFAATSFELRSPQAASAVELGELAVIREAGIAALENGILSFDRRLRMLALHNVVDAAEKLDAVGKELQELFAQSEPDALQMLSKLEQLESMLKELSEAAAKLDEGGLREFVNAREDEAKGLMEEIRKAIQEGRMDDAKAMMERLSKQLQQMAEGVRDTLEREKGEGDQSMQEAKQLTEELAQLEQKQRELQDKADELQQKEGADQADQQAKLWEEITAESIALQGAIEQYSDDLANANRDFVERTRARSASMQARELRAAAQLEDYRGTQGSLQAVRFAVDAMKRGVQAAQRQGGSLNGPGSMALKPMVAHIQRIQELLDQMEQGSSSPEMSQKSQELAEQQQELQKQLQQASEKADELSKKFPVKPGGMKESMDAAKERMSEASDDLGKGRPMPATGSQGAAADRIKEAKESLENAMEQAAQQQQGGESAKGEEKKNDPDNKGKHDSSDSPPEVEIPGAEDFRTPEEYRRALLEGMEGDVPEEYRALKKRYFEELVRQ